MNYEIKDGYLHVWFPLNDLPPKVVSRLNPLYVTPREAQVLAAVKSGLQNKEVAELLNISVRTAKFHTSKLLAKANVSNRTQLAMFTPRIQYYGKAIDLKRTIDKIESVKPSVHSRRRSHPRVELVQ